MKIDPEIIKVADGDAGGTKCEMHALSYAGAGRSCPRQVRGSDVACITKFDETDVLDTVSSTDQENHQNRQDSAEFPVQVHFHVVGLEETEAQCLLKRIVHVYEELVHI